METTQGDEPTPIAAWIAVGVVGAVALVGFAVAALGGMAGFGSGTEELLYIPEPDPELPIDTPTATSPEEQDQARTVTAGLPAAEVVGFMPVNDVIPTPSIEPEHMLDPAFVDAAIAFCAGERDNFGIIEADVPSLNDPDELVIVQHPDAPAVWRPHHQIRYYGVPEFVSCVETSPIAPVELTPLCPAVDMRPVEWTAISYASKNAEIVLKTRNGESPSARIYCPNSLGVDGAGTAFAHAYAPVPAAFARTDVDVAGGRGAAGESPSNPIEDLPVLYQSEAIRLCKTGNFPKTAYSLPRTDMELMVVEPQVGSPQVIAPSFDAGLPSLISCLETARGDLIERCEYRVLLGNGRTAVVHLRYARKWQAAVLDPVAGVEVAIKTGVVTDAAQCPAEVSSDSADEIILSSVPVQVRNL